MVDVVERVWLLSILTCIAAFFAVAATGDGLFSQIVWHTGLYGMCVTVALALIALLLRLGDAVRNIAARF